MEEDATKKSRRSPTTQENETGSSNSKRAIRTKIPFFSIVCITSDGVSANPFSVVTRDLELPRESYELPRGMETPFSPSLFMAQSAEVPILPGLT